MANDAMRRDGIVPESFVADMKERMDRSFLDLSKKEYPEKDIPMQEITLFSVWTWTKDPGLESERIFAKVSILLGESNVRITHWGDDMVKSGVSKLVDTGRVDESGRKLYQFVQVAVMAACTKDGVITVPEPARRKERKAK